MFLCIPAAVTPHSPPGGGGTIWRLHLAQWGFVGVWEKCTVSNIHFKKGNFYWYQYCDQLPEGNWWRPHYRWKTFKLLTKLSHLVTFKHCHIKSSAYTCRMVIGGQSKRTYFFGAAIKELKKTKISYEVRLCVQATVGSSVHTGTSPDSCSVRVFRRHARRTKYSFFLFLGIFRQWSQLIVSPDKTSNINSDINSAKEDYREKKKKID